jgi:glycosyltransferase involved in cell wall biosynthesis
VELLLITTRWPHGAVTEFLDDEIHHLVRSFDRVVVAPLRPLGPLAAGLPRAMTVDYSLAQHLERTRLMPGYPSRRLTAAVRASRPNRDGCGITRTDLIRDWRRGSWLRESLLGRADSASVAAWAVRADPPDIAYTFWLGAATVGLRAAWPGVPLVSRVHRSELYAEAHGWQSIPFQAASVRSVDLLAAVSEDGRAYLAGRYPGAVDKIVVRRLGVRDLGSPASHATSGALRILSASSITPIKRVRFILEVAQTLAKSGREVEWTHLGDGPGRAEVEEALDEAPASLSVHLSGHVPLEQVYRELQSGAHDVFLNLSLSEGAPVSLMEAQCVGLPVVATAVGGTPEVIPAGLNELVSPNDPASVICEAVLRASRRPPGEALERRRRWAQHYDADVNYAAWADELGRLASHGSLRPPTSSGF